jgi:hypothetical protein
MYIAERDCQLRLPLVNVTSVIVVPSQKEAPVWLSLMACDIDPFPHIPSISKRDCPIGCDLCNAFETSVA